MIVHSGISGIIANSYPCSMQQFLEVETIIFLDDFFLIIFAQNIDCGCT